MGIFELTPSIRQDTEFFSKALDELGMSKTQFNRKLKNLGISLSDNASKTNFLNNELKKIGSPLKYKNIITSRSKSALETGMGGVEPGKVGAPDNAKIWKDGTKVQKTAIKKFPDSVTKQRKYFVDTMKKIYGNIPKKKILDLFKRTITGIKNFSPMGMMQELSMDMIEKNPELINMMPGNTKPMTFNEGGMMDINEMTRPIGYNLGGAAGMTSKERTGYDRTKGYTENTNDLMRDIGSDLLGGIRSLFQGKEKSADTQDSLIMKRNQIIETLNNRVADQSLSPNKAAEIIDSITGGELNPKLIDQLFFEIVQQ